MVAKKLLAAALLMALPAVACARDYALTVYGGYRDGGYLSDVVTDERLDLDSSAAASLALDIGLDRSRQYQIFLSHQRTDLSLRGASAAGGESLGVDVIYLHIGGTYFWEGSVSQGPYVVGGIGATFLDPDSGYDSELRASLNLGLGYHLPIAKRLALRFEARGFATLVDSSGGFFCSGGCVISIKGDTITQGEVMLGLSTRF